MPRPKRNDDDKSELIKLEHERPKYVCYHEAGHAVVRWAFAHKFDYVYVRTHAEAESAGPGGGIFGSDEPFSNPPIFRGDAHSLRAPIEHTAHEAEIAMCCALAGAAGEAIYLCVDMEKSRGVREGSVTDRRKAKNLSELWRDPKEAAHVLKLAQWRAEALLKSPPGKEALNWVAQRLLETGKLKFQEVQAICQRIFRMHAPHRDQYRKNGLPKLDLLRCGMLPPMLTNFYQNEEAYARPPGRAGTDTDDNEEEPDYAKFP